MLGRCHDLGWGVAADPVRAAEHYRIAAEAGLDWGQYNLANLLARGAGMPRDLAAALAWYRRAAAQGHAKSINLVGRFLEEGWVQPPDAKAALHWYRRAAEGGDFRGQFNYGTVLARQGLTSAAAGWFQRAAASGSRDFLQSMARALAGQAAFRDAALLALRRCCDAGDPADFVAYARALLLNGDAAEARGWLRRARAAAHPEAAALLAALDGGRGQGLAATIRRWWIEREFFVRRIANDSQSR
jgi:TPR repeat protein